MKLEMDFGHKSTTNAQVLVLSGYCKPADKKNAEMILVNSHWPKELKDSFDQLKVKDSFLGELGTSFNFNLIDGTVVECVGLGPKKKDPETLRRAVASVYVKAREKRYSSLSIDLDGFQLGQDLAKTVRVVSEAIGMADYSYFKYKKEPKKMLQHIYLATKDRSSVKVLNAFAEGKKMSECVNTARTLINHPPNYLNSVVFAKEVSEDAKKLKRVKIKVLNKAEIKKENMNLLLAVNEASAHDPRVVHLTYTPKKVSKSTKHYCLVGKGLTFDTGGYSVKMGPNMVNMKFDMAGAATLYGAFKAAALFDSPHKITCVLGMTDNAIAPGGATPDWVVKGRSGKTVEILNTDAEGRLVLADCLDYACDLNPDAIIDAATLTGACLLALGSEVCAVMGNDDGLVKSLLHSSASQNENIWQLPIIEEYRNDIKSNIADIKNIAGSRFAGTAKAAAFLEHFIKNNVKWAHLDIAGIADVQSYLPYCPNFGASGLMVRSIAHFLTH